MRKSSLILLLAMAFVLTTVVSGFCVVNEVGEPCVICTDKTSGWDYGLEIELKDCDTTLQGTVCPCPTFDYETADGYCPGQDVKGILFKLCDCEKIDELDTAKAYAIRLTIMEPASGVYWTDVNPVRSDSNCFSTATSCTEATSVDPIRVTSFPDPSLEGKSYCVDPCGEGTLTNHSMMYYSVTSGQSLYNPTANATVDCCFTCGTNRVKAVQTCYEYIMHDLQSLLLIDIPTLVYDFNDINVQLGTSVKVKVEIVEEPATGDICGGSCKSMCECIVKIGEFSNCSPEGCNICLPYMPAADSGWWSGIGLSNSGSSASNVEITFYAAGTSAKYSLVVPAKSVTTLVLSSIMDDLAGLATGVPVYAQIVASGYYLNAYVMMGNGYEAQGYIGLCGTCGCSTCSK